MIRLSSDNIGKIYLGETEISKAYLGDDMVYDVGGSSGGGGDDNDYIQNGLVFHLDGIDKGTTDTTKWVDLVGGVVFTEQNGTAIHQTDHIAFSGSVWMKGDKTDSFGLSTHTIEMAAYLGQSYWQGIILYGNGKVGFFQNAGHEINVGANPGYNLGTYNSGEILLSAAGPSYVSNGVAHSDAPSAIRRITASLPVIGSLNASSLSYGFYGKIYSIRIYSRYISASEMLHNQKIDNERFNLGLTLPDTI